MNIVVLNGTEVKGCTHRMKETMLEALGADNEIKEYYFPKDCPACCKGCKACFLRDISVCPDRAYTEPIWASIIWADLVIVTSPAYLFGPTAQIKAVLDHFGTKWMVHSPEKELFRKQAVILTNAIGAGMKNVVRIIGSSLRFWGIPKIYVVNQALFDTDWEQIAKKRKANISRQCARAARGIQKRAGRASTGIRTKMMFLMSKTAQKMIHKSQQKKGRPETADHRHWSERGWLNGEKPWKNKRAVIDRKRKS